MNPVPLGRGPLTRADYELVVYGDGDVVLDDGGLVEKHRRILEELIASGTEIYSVTTGYGAEATQIIPAGSLGLMQENTVRSHAVGFGEPLPEAISRGMILLIASAAAKGAPAVSPAVVEALVEMLTRRIHPVVPALGSQSASDLIPAAHVALALVADPVTSRADDPACTLTVTLGPKDGSIINNSAHSTALGIHAAREARFLIDRTEAVAAMTLQAVRGHPEAFDERLIGLRPHPGAIATAANMRELLRASGLVRTDARPHDPFSLRCLPQIHGAIRDALAVVDRTLDIEIAAVTDNPVVLEGHVISGGNFHGEPLAIPFDGLALAVAELAALSQRRTQHLVLGDLAGAATPPKLSTAPSERLGMLMLPSLAAALVSECRQRTQPASRESIPVDIMEDHVSMASLAARQVLAGIRLARNVVATELAAAAQALEFHDVSLASRPTRRLHQEVRTRLAFLDEDRPINTTVLIGLV